MPYARPLAAAILLTPCFASAQDVAIDPAPSWVLPLDEAAEVPASGDAVTVLSYDTQRYFDGDAAHTFVRSRLRVDAPPGLQIGNVAATWTPSTSTMTLHEVTIERDGAMIDALGDGSAIRVIDAEPELNQAALHGAKTATLQVEGLRVGDVLRVSHTTRYSDPLIGAPVTALVSRPEAPRGTMVRQRYVWDGTAQWRTVGDLAGGGPTERAERDVVWTLPSVGPDAGEGESFYGEQPDGAPVRAYLRPRFELSSFERWEDVARLFEDAYAEAARVEPGSELAAAVAEIAARTDDPVLRADAALDLVQDQVRYLYSALGVGGYAPATAEEVWARRYGDCKGKTVLLLAMLDALGVEAAPALVSSELGDLLPEVLPSTDLFDHVIVRAEIGGVPYWLDGTQNAGAVIDSNLAAFGHALPMTDDVDTLTRIVPSPDGRAVRRVEIAVDGADGLTGALPVTIRQELRGPFAQSARAALPLNDEQRARALGYLLADLDARFEWDTVEIDAGPSGPAQVTATGTATLRTRDRNPGSPYLVPGADLGWTPGDMLTAKDREEPWFIGEQGDTTIRTVVSLPPDTPYYLGGANGEASAGGLTLSRRTEVAPGELTMTARWAGTVTEIAPEDTAGVAELLRKADWNEPTFTANPTSPAPDAEQSDFDAAIAAAKAADTEGFDRHFGLAALYFNAGRYADAVAAYDAALTLRPRDSVVLADRGMALVWLGRSEDAQDSFERALETDPASYVALHGLGVLAARAGAYEEGIGWLDRALAVSPGDDFAREWRAGALSEAGRHEEAVADARYLAAKFPDHAGYAGMVAGFLAEAGDDEAALAALEGLPDDTPAAQALSMRAQILETLDRPDEAADALSEAVRLDSGNAMAWNQLCWFKGTNGVQLDSALADCERALDLMPDSAMILDSRGLIHLRAGRLDEAVADYDAALADSPGQAASLFGRGLAKARQGDEAGAIADLGAARRVSALIDEEFEEYGLPAPEYARPDFAPM